MEIKNHFGFFEGVLHCLISAGQTPADATVMYLLRPFKERGDT
jgi:hypothetical protein